MRIARIGSVLVIVTACVAAPAFAVNEAHTGECRRLTRQIARYERDAAMADQRGNALWEDASRNRVARLETRRANLCPSYRRANPLAQFADFVASAAKAAAPYFIPGL
ncbi:MAG: hypothetical protein ABFS41_13510 [Myxococcota bacterium]